jgi:hypothetical protein
MHIEQLHLHLFACLCCVRGCLCVYMHLQCAMYNVHFRARNSSLFSYYFIQDKAMLPFSPCSLLILWYEDPLLSNDSEISSYTTAVAK